MSKKANISKDSLRTIYRLKLIEGICRKTHVQNAEARSLVEMNLTALLTEDVSEEEIANLKREIEESIKEIGVIKSAFPSGTMSNTSGYLDKLKGELDTAKGGIAKIDLTGDAAALKKVTDQAAQALAVSQKVKGSIKNAFSLLDRNLEGSITEEQLDTPIQDMAGQGDVPAATDLMKGIERSFQPPKGEQGFFKAIGSFFKGLFGGGGDLDVKAFSADVMGLSLRQMKEIKAKTDAGVTETTADEAAAAAPPTETDDSGKPSQDKKEEEGGEKPKEGEGEAEGQSEKEEEETDAAAEQEAQGAAEDAAAANKSLKQGAADIVNSWAEAGKTLSKNVSKKQRTALGDSLGGVFQKVADALSSETESAVDAWRGSQKVLQRPNVSDKQIDALKQSLAAFVGNVITTEASSHNSLESLKKGIIMNMRSFLIREASYGISELDTMDNDELFRSFVDAYCSRYTGEMKGSGLISEALISPPGYEDEVTDDELIQSRWVRMAGLGE